MIEFLKTIPYWYWIIAVIFSVFYSVRGVIEKKILLEQGKFYLSNQINKLQEMIIIVIQEVIFKFVVTMSGFVTFFIACYTFPPATQINSIGTGKVILLIFLFIWGITGICGYLTFFISRGKIPFTK